MSYPAISLTTATVGRHRHPQKRLQTAADPASTRIRAPTIHVCYFLSPLPVSSPRPSLSIGGFGVRRHRSTLQEHIETLKKADEERAESHSQEMDRVRNEAQRAEDQAQAQRREMEDSHREALAQTANTLEREGEARNERYQQLCSDTTTRVEEILAGALEESAKTNEAKFTETRETIARQKADGDAALAERDTKWRRTILILAGATLTAIAAAIAAVMMALT